MKFSGTITALATPFLKEKVDELSLKKLVIHQIENGVNGFVINGTTGESPVLEEKEVAKIFKQVRKIVGRKFPLIVGCGTNSTKKSMELARKAQAMGANGLLVVTPYYNKPTQEGLLQHFKAVASAAKKTPLILYNVPGRTITKIEPETVFQLTKVKSIKGIKEASGDLALGQKIAMGCPPNFTLLSGDDGTTVDFILGGGHGVISVLSHVIPKEFSELVARAQQKDLSAGQEFKKYSKLTELLFSEANPIPVKMALYFMKLIRSPELRLPLTTMSKDKAELLRAEMINCGVLRG